MDIIRRYPGINRALLSEEFFVQSLLQEARRLKALSDVEVESILAQFIGLLAANTERYTKGLSSSVRIDVAQSVLASNLYTVGLYLKSLPDTASAIERLRAEPLPELYKRGRRLIDSKLSVARNLYEFVRITRIQTQNQTYNVTIDEGIGDFFRQYDAEYEAHGIPASIDYQLLNPVNGLAGVEYMIRYLDNLCMENLFCLKFDPAVIHEVMSGYHEEYKDLLVNICGQVLQNALGCMAVKCPGLDDSNRQADIRSLDLKRSDIEALTSRLSGESRESILSLLKQLAGLIVERLEIENESILKYVFDSLPEISTRIHCVVSSGTLHTVFVLRKKSEQVNVARYSSSNKMDDEYYREVVKEILACRYSYDKVRIIKEHIRSLSDVEDVITDGELTSEEASTVLDMLNDIEIAVLTRRHPHYSGMEEDGYSESETRLSAYLDRYLRDLPEPRQRQIQELMRRIEEA